ncbi:MAG: hypothetical protein ACNA8H_00990 [Anaerolineales bacterium]
MPRWKSGSDARLISKRRKKLGEQSLVPLESIFVAARDGLLLKGEMERAKRWVVALVERLKKV